MTEQDSKYEGLDGLNRLFNECSEKQDKYGSFINKPDKSAADHTKIQAMRSELLSRKQKIEEHPSKEQFSDQEAIDDLLKALPNIRKPELASRRSK